MADQDFIHTAEIMKAALPYIDTKGKVMAELLIKVLDLLGILKSMTAPSNMAACGYESTKLDIEGLLTGIRPVCNHEEMEIVDRILNIFNAKRMFEMYNNFMSTMNSMQEFGGFSFTNSAEGTNQDIVPDQFQGFNFDSIFGHSSEQPEVEKVISAEDNPEHNPEEINVSEDIAGEKPPEPSGNIKMFEMLKSMIPPEQMSTFENLSMLFQTMSYDNNSKSDDSKEHDNG